MKIVDYWKYLFSHKPISISFAATQRCNSRCEQCTFWRQKPTNELELDEIIRIFDELYKYGIRFVYLAGGEPLMREDAEEIMKELSKMGYTVELSTNGILLSEDKIKNLSKIKNLNIVISLDSLTREGYAKLRGVDKFDTVLNNIELTKKYFGFVRINMTLNILNYKELEGMIDFCKQKGYYLSVYPYNSEYTLFVKDSQLLDYTAVKKEFAETFYRLSELCKKERHIFGYSGIYKVAGDWVMGKRIGRCSALREYLYLSSDGNLCVCFNDFEPIINLSTNKLEGEINYEVDKIDRCNRETPCFWGCTRGLAIVRENKLDVIKELVVGGKVFHYLRVF